MSYLPVVAAPAVAHFRENAIIFGEAQVWYEYQGQGVALKWQYPIGCVFDTYCTTEDLPLEITVHFQGMPKQIVPCKDADAVETSFFSSLKQALYLKFGTTEAVRDLPVSKQSELWEAIASGNLEKYWGICNAMYFTGTEVDASKPKAAYPIRILVKDANSGTIICLQRPIPVDTTGNMTLYDLLHKYFIDSVKLPESKDSKIDQRIVIAGINPPLDSSVDGLCSSLSHADNFLYICIRN
mmetsp:Transcript_17288/g.21282  ORF Transcript_17288/g.21282 Transcript_17288/m.21282 type:complete len:240 (+) Transcript_17288:3-722(+)